MKSSAIIRYLLVGAGVVSMILGTAGLIFPILPTTPFLLLSAACFARGSKRFYKALTDHPRLGRYILDYREKGGITAGVKATALSLLWISMLCSILIFTQNIWVRILLTLTAAAVSVHILRLKTLPSKKDSKEDSLISDAQDSSGER